MVSDPEWHQTPNSAQKSGYESVNTFSYLSLHVKDVPVFFSCYVLHATIVQNARKSDASTDESDLYLLPPARESRGREKRDDREREQGEGRTLSHFTEGISAEVWNQNWIRRHWSTLTANPSYSRYQKQMSVSRLQTALLLQLNCKLVLIGFSETLSPDLMSYSNRKHCCLLDNAAPIARNVMFAVLKVFIRSCVKRRACHMKDNNCADRNSFFLMLISLFEKSMLSFELHKTNPWPYNDMNKTRKKGDSEVEKKSSNWLTTVVKKF